MTEEELKTRTRQFALRVMSLVEALPDTKCGRTVANQLVRSGTSIGANYRAACRARSTAEFVSKLGISEEEADESLYWLELVIEGKMLPAKRVNALLQEADELLRILIVSRKTAERKLRATRQIQTPKSKLQNPHA